VHIQPAKVFVGLCKKEAFPTVDGSFEIPRPTTLGIVLNPCEYLSYQLVQDFFHQQ